MHLIILFYITFIYFLFCQLQISDSKFNLYNTDRSLMINVFGYDCLYYDEGAATDSFKSLAPFCIRLETIKQLNDEDELCHGKALTFKQLKTNNIKINDLFDWNAIIEIVRFYHDLENFVNMILIRKIMNQIIVLLI